MYLILSNHCQCLAFVAISVCLSIITLPTPVYAQSADSKNKPVRLLDKQPFDRVTLDAASGNEVIDTLLLELPNRTVPDPLPSSGTLELRRLSEPSVLYTVPWSSISRIDLYEQLLLAEANKLSQSKDLEQAFEYLNFLHQNYSQLAGLKQATERYLRQDAVIAYGNKNYDEALIILLSLYDLNPRHSGLKKVVEAVTDRLIAEHLASKDFASARSVLDLMSTNFSLLSLSNISVWQDKFEKGSARQLAIARQAINRNEFTIARQALRQALAILPSNDGVDQLLSEIEMKSPQVTVGVDSIGNPLEKRFSLDWSNARIAQLTQPGFFELAGFGAEGGVYQCDWADIVTDDTGLQLEIALNSEAQLLGITAEVVALEFLRQANPGDSRYRSDFAVLLQDIELRRGNQVVIHWHRPHVRPESLCSLALQRVSHAKILPGVYRAKSSQDDPLARTFNLPLDKENSSGPDTIVEKYYDNEDAAFEDLLSGELDIIARVPPWQLTQLQRAGGVEVGSYQLPTIHALLPNYDKPIMGRREFRRALCYGIDRPQILNSILLGGENRPGNQVISGPLSAGRNITDPIGYAYNHGLQPRPYEPRLAAVLATVARNSLAKQAKQQDKTAKPESEEAGKSEADPQPTTPLILAHSANPVATIACQSIKLQLDAIGIPIQLKPIGPEQDISSEDYDLRYAEIAIWEPIVDARRLLGPEGVAGNCSSSMSLALRDLDQAKNWKEARLRLQEVHHIAFNDLQVIPLWQTFDNFAFRKNMHGLGTTPVSLYQNTSDWKRAVRGAGR